VSNDVGTQSEWLEFAIVGTVESEPASRRGSYLWLTALLGPLAVVHLATVLLRWWGGSDLADAWDTFAVQRWFWARFTVFVAGGSLTGAVGSLAEAAWAEDATWSPRVIGFILAAVASAVVALGGLALVVIWFIEA
jgi:hypothetical protein